MRVRVHETPAGINVNSLNFPHHWAWHGKPTLGIFNLDEMNDDVGKHIVHRNFGTYDSANITYHVGRTFSIPFSLEDALRQGEVPSEVHEGFARGDIPFSKEAFSKPSLQLPGSWAIIDEENKQIQYARPVRQWIVNPASNTKILGNEFIEVNKNGIFNRRSGKFGNCSVGACSHSRHSISRSDMCFTQHGKRG